MAMLLLLLPWLFVLVWVLFVVRYPPELPPPAEESLPTVSVIIPARNEAINIGTCVASVAASAYPDFEIIVVDDRSEDDTGDIARSVAPGNARRVLVLDGEELPEGWLGKPWACWQGASRATGELLLFTDADTTHGPRLMARAVAGLRTDPADLLTVVGRQLMETFWERLVQPQIFLTMLFRFPRFAEIAKNGVWRDAIANGQFMLFRRDSYDAIGGHEAVRDEVVEDVALAQLVKREGKTLRVWGTLDDFATRMYRSLSELIGGWSKNMVMGGMQSVPPSVRPVLVPVSFVVGVGLWIVPVVALIAALFGFGGSLLLAWSACAYAIGAFVFGYFTHVMRGPAIYGLLFPLGACAGTYIFLRSVFRWRRVEWKGREYLVRPVSERP